MYLWVIHIIVVTQALVHALSDMHALTPRAARVPVLQLIRYTSSTLKSNG